MRISRVLVLVAVVSASPQRRILGAISDAVDRAGRGIRDGLGRVGRQVGGAVGGVVDKIVEGTKSAIDNVGQTATDVYHGSKEGLGKVLGNAGDALTDAYHGAGDGLTDAYHKLGHETSGFLTDAKDYVYESYKRTRDATVAFVENPAGEYEKKRKLLAKIYECVVEGCETDEPTPFPTWESGEWQEAGPSYDLTENGCECRLMWTIPDSPCNATNLGCSPEPCDGDRSGSARGYPSWCITRKGCQIGGEDRGWDYCKPQNRTEMGCKCQSRWRVTEGECNDGDAHYENCPEVPCDGDTNGTARGYPSWCLVEDGCPYSWDYCQPEGYEPPTLDPTLNPTSNPTRNPTLNPTRNPTLNPTRNPTFNPTRNPTFHPTRNPTFNPTLNPTFNPTLKPTTPTNPPGEEDCGAMEREKCKETGRCSWNKRKRSCMLAEVKGDCTKMEKEECKRDTACEWDKRKKRCTTLEGEGCAAMEKDECRDAETCEWDKKKKKCSNAEVVVDGCAKKTSQKSCKKLGGCSWDKKRSRCKAKKGSSGGSECGKKRNKRSCDGEEGCKWDRASRACNAK